MNWLIAVFSFLISSFTFYYRRWLALLYPKVKQAFLFLVIFFLSACSYTPWVKYFVPHRKGHFPKSTKQDKLVGGINRYRSCYDVIFYDIKIKPEMNRRHLTGEVNIHFKTLKDFDTLLLDLHPAYKINALSSASSDIIYKRKKNALFIIFKEQQKTNTFNKISIRYDGAPISMFGQSAIKWEKDKNGKPLINCASQGIGSNMLWPCKDLLYDEADSSMLSIIVPNDLVAIGNGKLRNKTDNEKETTYTWFNSNPINIYNIAFQIGDYVNFSIPNARSKPDLSAWVLSYNLEKGKSHLQQLSDELKFLEDIYGEYPWYNDGYKIIETPHVGGMEHQTAIACKLSFANNGAGFNDLLVHESAHEWWGNSMSAKDYDDAWLHESFATFSEYLYLEHRNGLHNYMDVMGYLMHDPAARSLAQNKVPIVKPANVRYCAWAASRDQDIYHKGCFMLHTLRCYFENDGLFFSMLKEFYAEHKKSIITRFNFIDHVNKIKGENLDWFFKQYLYDYRLPVFEYRLSAAKGKDDRMLISYRWKETGEDFSLPVWIINGDKKIKLIPGAEFKEMELVKENELRIDKSKGYFRIHHK
jgi:aminopeptidase N